MPKLSTEAAWPAKRLWKVNNKRTKKALELILKRVRQRLRPASNNSIIIKEELHRVGKIARDITDVLEKDVIKEFFDRRGENVAIPTRQEVVARARAVRPEPSIDAS